MNEIMRKMLLVGIGAAALTTEKLERLVNDWVRRGDLSIEEGKALVHEYSARGTREAAGFVREFGQRGSQQAGSLGRDTLDRLRGLAGDMGLATREDLSRLSARVAALETELNQRGTPSVDVEPDKQEPSA